MSSRILVIDDTPANIRLLRNKLRAHYFQVESAANAQEALEKLEASPPDLILMDVMMPGMNGFELCREIKKNEHTEHLPIIMVTALQDGESRVMGLEAGADDFLSRPIDDQILLSRIRSLERLKGLVQEVELRLNTAEQLGVRSNVTSMGSIDTSGSTALIAEPDELTRGRLIPPLELDLGMHVLVRDEPLGAAGLLPGTTPDLLIVNANQSEMGEGLHATAAFRSAAETRQNPVIMIFDHFDPTLIGEAFDAGVSDYLVKPIDLFELRARAKTQLKRLLYVRKLERIYEASIHSALTDQLTGLYNRRFASQHLPAKVEQATRVGQPVSLLMIDTDNFKTTNDRFGHEAGDDVLKAIADTLVENLRNVDVVSRWGGDEFLVLLPETNGRQAQKLAQRVLKSVSKLRIQTTAGRVTTGLSIGVASTAQSDGTVEHLDWLDLMRNADRALYSVKESGKGRVGQL